MVNASIPISSENSMKSVVKKIGALFLQGFLPLLPLLVTLYAIYLVFSFVDGMAENVLYMLLGDLSGMYGIDLLFKCTVVILLVVSVAFFGIFIRTMVGKALLGWFDAVFTKLPGLNSIYSATRQVVDIFRSGKKQFFTNPVLVEYPSAGIWSIGFNTGELFDRTAGDTTDKRFTVFIPTTPNPTSGFLAIVSQQQLQKLDLSVEDAIKMILTGGIVKKEQTGTAPLGDLPVKSRR